MSLDSLLLSRLAPWRSSSAWWVAFSGGLDSTVLLHALTRLSERQALPVIRAIHVHHGLQAAGDHWPAHCQRVCDQLGVTLEIVRVRVVPGASLERAARDARYQAFSACVREGELLLTGQHRDDQPRRCCSACCAAPVCAGWRRCRMCDRWGAAAWFGRCWRSPGPSWRIMRVPTVSPGSRIPAISSWSIHATFCVGRSCLCYSSAGLGRRQPGAYRRAYGRGAALARRACAADLAAAQAGSDCRWLNLPSLALAPLRELTSARQRNALRHWLAGLTLAPDENHWSRLGVSA